MKITGNTILVTGGGSGIGRGLAEAFHDVGNKVIIAGRRADLLEMVAAARPGMAVATVDMTDAASIATFGKKLLADHPDLNIVVHNAGIMRPESLTAANSLEDAEATVATNLLGPIRLTTALMPHLLTRSDAAILTVSSGLAFVPLVATPTYSATKAAIHAYTQCLREQLRDTPVQVIEIAPPYVQTQLMGEAQASDPAAMPLPAFIAEVMAILTQEPDATEVIVERCKPLRNASETGSFSQVFAALNRLSH